MSDIFMLWAIGRYWESLVLREMDWKESFVISAKDLCQATLTIEMSSRPLLVQVFGTHYLLSEGLAYKTSSIMEAVTLWFKCLDRWYAGVLDWEVKAGGKYVPRTQIKEVISDIFEPKERYSDLGTMLHQRPLE